MNGAVDGRTRSDRHGTHRGTRATRRKFARPWLSGINPLLNPSLVATPVEGTGTRRASVRRWSSTGLAGLGSQPRRENWLPRMPARSRTSGATTYMPISTTATERPLTRLTGHREYVDWRRLRDQVFVRAREGEPITYQKYDSSTYCSSCCWLQVLRDRPIVTVLTGHLYNDIPSSLTHR